MDTEKHSVKKRINRYEIKRILSDYMKSLGYKPMNGTSYNEIGIDFDCGKNSGADLQGAIFTVMDMNNPEPESVWVPEKEALEIIAKAKRLDIKTYTIHISH